MYMKVKEARDVFRRLKLIKFTHLTKEARRFVLNLMKDPALDPQFNEYLDLDMYVEAIN